MPKNRDMPTRKQRQFAKKYVETGSVFEAYVDAYDPEANKSVHPSTMKNKVRQLLHNPKVAWLISHYQKALIHEAPKSIQKLTELRDTSQDERVQLFASKELIASFDKMMDRELQQERWAKEKEDMSKHSNVFLINMSDEELKNRIAGLIPGSAQAESNEPSPDTDGGSVGE